MKKYLLFLCVFVILGACTNTIGYLPDDEPKKLIVYNPQIEMFAHFKTKSSFHKTKRII